MRRREFISLLCGVPAARLLRPLPARATDEMSVIGLLGAASQAWWKNFAGAFDQGLKEARYVEGQNVLIEYRWAEGRYDQLPMLVADLIGRPVAVIVAVLSPAALAAKAATSTVPIVFSTGGDPIKEGLVPALNRPGPNITGVSFFAREAAAKRLQLLHELVAPDKTIAVLENPSRPNAVTDVADAALNEAARTLARKLLIVKADSADEIDASFAAIANQKVGALLVSPDSLFSSQTKQLVTLAERYAIPTMYYGATFPKAGGLMSYSADIPDVYRQIGLYTGQILAGARLSELPVVQSTKFEFVINFRGARAVGINIPDRLLALADEVIE